jgi:hypothetical protein
MEKKLPKSKGEVSDDHQINNVPVAGLELLQFLVDGPELLLKDNSTEQSQNRLFETFALLGASQLSIETVKKLVLASAKMHAVTFPQVFYKEMFRLKGWKVTGVNVYRKPWLVAKYTKEVIYGRFTREILMAIQIQNPYIVPGVRRFKHFQYLNELGHEKLVQFIDEAVVVMKESTSWYEFRVKMFQQYGLPYQVDLFN